MGTRRFTILHSNDMHGDFLAEMAEGKDDLVGGLALLSGYINKVREEEDVRIAGRIVEEQIKDRAVVINDLEVG